MPFNGKPWNLNLCKYCLRILKSLPKEPSLGDYRDESILFQLEKQLFHSFVSYNHSFHSDKACSQMIQFPEVN